ncbi:hypothetical protein [Hoeflea sp.]|uniref:hypothetical protein n=1 Tax=Hoeflea sp. TaxID=1940281 RepID=UPI003B0189E6
MNNAFLRADCARCAALCCVALAFDKSERFGIDKPAGQPCPHLHASHRCTIHAARGQSGFAGCVDYDCLGAGQRVTQEVFNGRTCWGDHASLRRMMNAFRAMRKVHELLFLLQTAEQLQLSANQRRTASLLVQHLSPRGGWTVDTLSAFERGTLPDTVHAFLKSLRRAARFAG